MIRKSRFIAFFETWNETEKEQLITQLNRLIKDNQEYADSNNYGHLCNLLTSIAMIMVLEQNGKTREEAEKGRKILRDYCAEKGYSELTFTIE